MNKREIGSKYENIAKNYLINNGYKIIDTNFRVKFGEIDIIAINSNYLCFIEVKYRGEGSLGTGFDAVDKRKQKTIYNVAKIYLVRKQLDENDLKCRFDVISIDENNNIELLKNAFP